MGLSFWIYDSFRNQKKKQFLKFRWKWLRFVMKSKLAMKNRVWQMRKSSIKPSRVRIKHGNKKIFFSLHSLKWKIISPVHHMHTKSTFTTTPTTTKCMNERKEEWKKKQWKQTSVYIHHHRVQSSAFLLFIFFVPIDGSAVVVRLWMILFHRLLMFYTTLYICAACVHIHLCGFRFE